MPEELEYFYTDNLGSRLAVTDASGAVTERFTYSDWGQVKSGPSHLASYTGKQMDATGLWYFNARFYDPKTGRFVSEDSAHQGINWYAYCGNNPINLVDPNGMESKTPEEGILQNWNSDVVRYNTAREGKTPDSLGRISMDLNGWDVSLWDKNPWMQENLGWGYASVHAQYIAGQKLMTASSVVDTEGNIDAFMVEVRGEKDNILFETDWSEGQFTAQGVQGATADIIKFMVAVMLATSLPTEESGFTQSTTDELKQKVKDIRERAETYAEMWSGLSEGEGDYEEDPNEIPYFDDTPTVYC